MIKNSGKMLLALASVGWSVASAGEGAAAKPFLDPEDDVYQYCVSEDPTDPKNPRCYWLWVPPRCARIPVRVRNAVPALSSSTSA